MLRLRGLGDSVVIGPDGQPRVVTSGPINVDTVEPSGQNVIQDASGNVIYVPINPATATWLPGIPNWVTGVCGAVAALVVVKAMR